MRAAGGGPHEPAEDGSARLSGNARPHPPVLRPPVMDRLTLVGVAAVTSMVVFYALEHRSRWFVLAFAGSCGLASVYGFLQGAWPFGVVEAIWAVVALRRWARISS